MLNLKGAANKEWKQIEKKPVKRKTISTSIEKNANKRYIKLIKKDARRIQNQAAAQKPSGLEDVNASESDFTFGSEDEEWNKANLDVHK